MDDMEIIEAKVGELLVQIARYTLEQFVRHKKVIRPNMAKLPSAVQQPGATFVTLRLNGKLRGCIGNVVEERPLAESVARNTIGAASRDPRFKPVTRHELAPICVEVTVLTPLQPLIYNDYDDLLHKIEPGRDGLMLQWESRRGVLLPQMWERIQTTADFVTAVAKKANIPVQYLTAHPPVVTVYTFQAQHFAEVEEQ